MCVCLGWCVGSGPLHLPRLFHVNARGTECVLNAAQVSPSVSRFIHLSSTAAVTSPSLNPAKTAAHGWSEADFADSHACLKGVTNADDALARLPHPFASDYGFTKAVAETLVLAANSNKLRTIALRPHTVFGAGDAFCTQQFLDSRWVPTAELGTVTVLACAFVTCVWVTLLASLRPVACPGFRCLSSATAATG